jgi:hypothetical protein
VSTESITPDEEEFLHYVDYEGGVLDALAMHLEPEYVAEDSELVSDWIELMDAYNKFRPALAKFAERWPY